MLDTTMPIITFSATDSLKQLLDRAITFMKSRSRSSILRNAIEHYLNTKMDMYDIAEIDGDEYLINGTVIVTIRCDENSNETMKKICRIEEERYRDNITSFSTMRGNDGTMTCVSTFAGNIFTFNNYVDEMGMLENTSQMRYIIN
jgi:metal-responsive CopG/Arc/MetJ family transcriptional regulator